MSDPKTTEPEAIDEIEKQSGDTGELTPEQLADLSGGVTVPSTGTDTIRLNHNQTWMVKNVRPVSL